jgi:hypothetical protein
VLTLLATLMVVGGLTLAGLAAHVAWRRESRIGWSLATLLVSVAWWGLAYAVELSVDDIATKSRWGDLKYVGITTLVPAWLVFVLQYTGRGRHVTGRLLTLLAIEPVLTMMLLVAERVLILRMLQRTRWNRKEAAEILGISYKALLYKIKENGLDKAS